MASIVYIIDDDRSVRRSLVRLVREGGYQVEAFASAEEFLSAVPGDFIRPTCAVVDLHMPGLSGLELQERLNARPLSCPVIFVSGNGDIPATVKAMRDGAVTFLTKPFHDGELLAAIAEGIEVHRMRIADSLHAGRIRQRIETLSERERETMSWVITGALNKQIAGELGIAERTVKAHRAKAMEKMGVVSVAELVRLCDEVGFAAAK